jgi:hypothetical protein
LTNTSSVSITVTPTVIVPWVTVSGPVVIPAFGTGTLTITANPGGLTGVNTANVTLSNSTGGTQTVAVSFTVGTQAGLKKRGCTIGSATSPDSAMWLLGLLASAVLLGVNRRRV